MEVDAVGVSGGPFFICWWSAGSTSEAAREDVDVAEGEQTQMPRAVLVKFPTYTGPNFPGLPEKVLPLTPTTVHWVQGTTACWRKQFPLALAWAVTIHKSQGMSIGPGQVWERMVVSLGKRELSAGLSFVAFSRAMNLGCVLFPQGELPSQERLALCAGKCVKARQAEDSRLEALSTPTIARHQALISAGVRFAAH